MGTLATVTMTRKALLDIGSTYSEAGSRLKRMKKKNTPTNKNQPRNATKAFCLTVLTGFKEDFFLFLLRTNKSYFKDR